MRTVPLVLQETANSSDTIQRHEVGRVMDPGQYDGTEAAMRWVSGDARCF